MSNKTILSIYVEDNKDRDDLVGDLSYDLYHDKKFQVITNETEQLAYINQLVSKHGRHLVDAVKSFKKEYKEYSREL